MGPTEKNLRQASLLGKTVAERLYQEFVLSHEWRGPGFNEALFPGNLKDIAHAQINLSFSDKIRCRDQVVEAGVLSYLSHGADLTKNADHLPKD